MLSDKTLKRMSAYVAKLDTEVAASAAKLVPSKQSVTASSLRGVIAQLKENAISVQKVYAGFKKILSNRTAYAKASKNAEMAKILSDIAIVATKIDLVMAVAEAELADEVDTENLDSEDILNDLQNDTGVDMSAEGEPEFDGEPEPEGEPELEGEPEGEPELEGDPEVPTEGEGEPEGEPELEGEPDGDEATEDDDLDGDIDFDFDTTAGDEDEGDFDGNFDDIFPEDDAEEATTATMAKVAKTAKTTVQAKAKATAKPVLSQASGVQLFDFIGKGN